jgi:hypothetical protein
MNHQIYDKLLKMYNENKLKSDTANKKENKIMKKMSFDNKDKLYYNEIVQKLRLDREMKYGKDVIDKIESGKKKLSK